MKHFFTTKYKVNIEISKKIKYFTAILVIAFETPYLETSRLWWCDGGGGGGGYTYPPLPTTLHTSNITLTYEYLWYLLLLRDERRHNLTVTIRRGRSVVTIYTLLYLSISLSLSLTHSNCGTSATSFLLIFCTRRLLIPFVNRWWRFLRM